MMTHPLVTVGIALYNHERYIKECIESILNQTYEDIEIIIIDDGSKDNSYEVAKATLESQSKRHYILKTRTNLGMCNTLNEIATLSHGKYISFIGSDDFWHPDKTTKQVEYLESNPEVALVHANSWVVDGNSMIYSELDYSTKHSTGKLFESILTGKGGINTPCHLYHREVYETIGMYDPQFRFEDTDFWLRLTKQYNVGFISENLSYYRIHTDNLSRDDNLLKFYNDEIINIYKKNVTDTILLEKSLVRMYRKSFLRALRKGKLNYILKYLPKLLLCKFLGKC